MPGFVFRSGLSVAAIRERADNMNGAIADIMRGKDASRLYALDELTSWQIERGKNGQPELVIADHSPAKDATRIPTQLKARLLCNLFGIYADEVDAAWKRYAEATRSAAGGPVTTWPNR